mgnify:FL=1
MKRYQSISGLKVDSTKPGWILAKHGFDDETPKEVQLLKSDKTLTLPIFQNLPASLKAALV